MSLLSISKSSIVNFVGKVTSFNENSDWISDSGASEHIAFSKTLLFDSQDCNPNLPVLLPNGNSIPVQSLGKALMSNFVLHNVLYIPSFHCNLASISKLTRDYHCAVTFFPTFCVLQDLAAKRLIGMGEMKGGLYRFKKVCIPLAAATISFT